MKKIIVTAVTLGLVAGAMIAPADAAKKKKPKPVVRVEKVVELAYTGGEAGASTPAASGGGCLYNQPAFSCKELIPPGTEFKYVKIEVQDASGQTVGGFLSQQDNDGDGLNDGYGDFCGSHAESVPLEVPGSVVAVSLFAGACSDGSSPSTPTTGTIVATFSNLP